MTYAGQTYRIADFQDYGLALAATVLFNNAKAIKTALSTITAQAAALVAAEERAVAAERLTAKSYDKVVEFSARAEALQTRVAELEAGRQSEREAIAQMLTERARLARMVIETYCEPEAQIFEMLAREILSNEEAGK